MNVKLHIVLKGANAADELFDWVTANIPKAEIVRQQARGVDLRDSAAWGRGDPPQPGWVAQVVVTNQQAADLIIAECERRGASAKAW